MTELSKKILESYQIRKTAKQKLAFIDLLMQYFPDLQVQEVGFPKCRNLILGDVENAKVLLTAHYDTCAWMPLPNLVTPKAPILTILYGFLLYIPIILAVFLLNLVLSLLNLQYPVFPVTLIASLGLLSLMFVGPANKHTANDNTSGVITLCELMLTLSREQRSKVAFVFFDYEELGLLGSYNFRSRFKTQIENKLVINFDCISDGDHILVAASKAARADYGAMLDSAFNPSGDKSILLCNAEKVYYPSDQAVFKKGVAVAALNKAPIIGYYMGRIHTHRDTVFDRENLRLVCQCTLELLKKL